MARKSKEPTIKLKYADRSGPDPSNPTLLDLAEQRGLLKDHQTGNDGSDAEEASVGRWGESLLWSFSMAMGHLTLDVLVAHQYAVEIDWPQIFLRTTQAFPIILILFYLFHSHPSPPAFVPVPPSRIQPVLHQLLFFSGALCAGSYLIHITNTYSYYAVMKQAPPMGILWIWSVIELDLPWAAASLACCGIFLKAGGYSLT